MDPALLAGQIIHQQVLAQLLGRGVASPCHPLIEDQLCRRKDFHALFPHPGEELRVR